MQLINTDTGTYTEKIHFSPLNITKLSEIAKKLKECPYALCDYTTGGLLFGIRELYSPEISEVNDHIFLSVKEDDGKRKFLMPISKDSERSLLLLKEYIQAIRQYQFFAVQKLEHKLYPHPIFQELSHVLLILEELYQD